MNSILFRFAAVASLIFLSASFSRADLADGVKAIVNDTVITYAQVEDYTAPAADVLRRQYAGQPELYQQKLNEALNESLEQLVERQLILHNFDTAGYQLPESAVNELVQQRIRERFGDRITLMKTLQAQGMTYEQFRQEVRDQYIESALRNKNVSQEIIISPYKVEQYYLAHQDDFKVEDEVKLHMIVLPKANPDDAAPRKMAEDILADLKNGASFEQMASVYSQGSQQRQGGDWGWVERSVLRGELADAAFNLSPGQNSSVIETSDSCYIMHVDEKRPAHVKPLNEVRNDIEKNLRAQEQAHIQKQWIDGLKKKTYIRYF